jgi:hypothetical protein
LAQSSKDERTKEAFLSLAARVRKKDKLRRRRRILAFCMGARACEFRQMGPRKVEKSLFTMKGCAFFILFVPAKGAIQCATISSKKNAY